MHRKLSIFLLLIIFLLLPSQLGLHFWPEQSFYGQLRIDYLSPTLFFTDLLIGIFILLNINLLKFPKPQKIVSLLTLLLILLNIVTSLWPAFTLYKWLVLSLYLTFAYLLTKLKYSRQIFLKGLAIALLWSASLAIMQFLNSHNLGGLWWLLGERPLSITSVSVAKASFPFIGTFLRAYATFPHPNALAGFLLVGLILIRSAKTNSSVSTLVSIISTVALFLTFSRAAIVLYFLYLIYLLKQSQKSPHKLIVSLVIFIFMAAFIFSTNTSFQQTSFIERKVMIHQSLSNILHHPLLGVGLGVSLLQPTRYLQPVHNIILLLINELGLLLIIVAVWKYCRIIFRFSLISLIVFLTGLVDHYWLTSHSNLLLLVILGAVWLNGPHGKANN